MLALERFAEVRAEIERTADRDRTLHGAGISPREWIRIQRHWLAALAGEAALGRKDLAERYCRAFEGPSGAPEPASPPVSEARPPEGPQIVPSYLAGMRAAPAVVQVHVTEAAPGAPIALPDVAPAAPRRGGTLADGGRRGPVTPFREAPPGQPPPAPAAPAVPRAGLGTGTTPTLDVPRHLVTPFRGEKEAAPAPTPIATAPAPVAPVVPPAGVAPHPPGDRLPAVNVAPAAVTGTTLDLGLAKIVAAIPFKSAGTGAAQGAGDAQGGRSPAAQGAGDAQGAGAPVPEITVEQYAWLVAALRRARGPADVEQAFRALHLSSELHRPLEALWRARMAADPALQKRFLAALAQHFPGGSR